MKKLTKCDKKGVLGFKLLRISGVDSFRLYAEDLGGWEGSLKEVWQKMNWTFGIKNEEIRTALSEMEENRHSTAIFGIFGTFICTYNE